MAETQMSALVCIMSEELLLLQSLHAADPREYSLLSSDERCTQGYEGVTSRQSLYMLLVLIY